ncbi:MAG: HupE/UreJ family protein [Pseudomonadota bacterium]
MTKLLRWFSLFVLSALILCPSQAHEVNPAYLELQEVETDTFSVTWKQPLKDGRRLRLIPAFPDTCTRSEEAIRSVGAAVVETWNLACDLRQGDLRIDGLQRTLTDVFVRISYLNGDSVAVLLRPNATQFSLDTPQSGAPLLAYLWLGVEHILFGYDHLLFVLGLCLLIKIRNLFQTITAFTIAHSITLALATLGNVSMPGPPVEAVIAVSLVMLAREALRAQSGTETLTARLPWLVAFGFGLIHGFGFAGALSDIGLPTNQEAWALLLFNLGVELGQIAFVIAVLSAFWLVTQINRNWRQHLQFGAAYFVGIAGTYWAIERVLGF